MVALVLPSGAWSLLSCFLFEKVRIPVNIDHNDCRIIIKTSTHHLLPIFHRKIQVVRISPLDWEIQRPPVRGRVYYLDSNI